LFSSTFLGHHESPEAISVNSPQQNRPTVSLSDAGRKSSLGFLAMLRLE
jgi:hypothetical protein